MDVRVELIVDYVWAAEYDKTGFLSVGVNIFDRLYLKELPISLPMVPMSTIKQKYSLPAGGNCFFLFNSTSAIGNVVFNGFKRGGVDVAWTL